MTDRAHDDEPQVIDIVAIIDRELSALDVRRDRTRSLRRAALKDRHHEETRRMFAWYMAEPGRTKAETAQHFGINPNTLATRFWKLGLYGIGPHAETKARRAARKVARAA
ncbi:hypothetical protein FHP25_24860 [Vineibacter terrae]|uniref:Uncharacterized protein n=1 Tax=Vineibacter terrae TaxID=2586908 RepID=A0A5C8PFF0_9HYPH|nr:hypothetical protein [Vineibacter terrae]TXL72529.1 hypothetical protein FHP25_24860 [Vineibacter terrae]